MPCVLLQFLVTRCDNYSLDCRRKAFYSLASHCETTKFELRASANGATGSNLRREPPQLSLRLGSTLQNGSMSLREAMAHLGHGSKTIHLAYSEKAEVVTLPLEYYEDVKRRKLAEFKNSAAIQ